MKISSKKLVEKKSSVKVIGMEPKYIEMDNNMNVLLKKGQGTLDGAR